MTAEISHDAHALRLDETLYRVSDIAGSGSGLHGSDPAHHGLVSHLDQPFRFAGDRAHRIHPAGIAVPALDNESDVDVDDVAVLQQPVSGHAVADHVVDRGAGGIPIATIHQCRRVGAAAERKLPHEIVDPGGRNSRLDDIGEFIEALRHQCAGFAHASEAALSMQLDLPGFAQGGVAGFDVAHGRIMIFGERVRQPNLMFVAPTSKLSWKNPIVWVREPKPGDSKAPFQFDTSTVASSGSVPPRTRISRTG